MCCPLYLKLFKFLRKHSIPKPQTKSSPKTYYTPFSSHFNKHMNIQERNHASKPAICHSVARNSFQLTVESLRKMQTCSNDCQSSSKRWHPVPALRRQFYYTTYVQIMLCEAEISKLSLCEGRLPICHNKCDSYRFLLKYKPCLLNIN